MVQGTVQMAIIQRLWIPTAINRRRRWCKAYVYASLTIFRNTEGKELLISSRNVFNILRVWQGNCEEVADSDTSSAESCEWFARPVWKHLSSDLERGKRSVHAPIHTWPGNVPEHSRDRLHGAVLTFNATVTRTNIHKCVDKSHSISLNTRSSLERSDIKGLVHSLYVLLCERLCVCLGVCGQVSCLG